MDYTAEITAKALQWGVPVDIALAVARAESGGNPAAVSSRGAIGLFQLMPDTAADLGVDPYDPIQNIDGGVRYLKWLYNRYGDWSLAIAGYNAGPGNVDRYGGVPPFRETRNYLAKILGWLGVQVEEGTPTFTVDV